MENFRIILATIRQRGAILYGIMETGKYACKHTHTCVYEDGLKSNLKQLFVVQLVGVGTSTQHPRPGPSVFIGLCLKQHSSGVHADTDSYVQCNKFYLLKWFSPDIYCNEIANLITLWDKRRTR
jgi:hypothetical protein